MIAKATIEDLKEVCNNIRRDDLREVLMTQWGDDLADSLIVAPGVKVAVRNRFGAVAVMGVVPVWPGVGQAWLIGTSEVGRHGVEVAHAAKRVIKTLLDLEMHRIHAYSAAFHIQSHKWLEMIGFRKEATLKQYGKTGEDFHLYAISRPISDEQGIARSMVE